VITFYKINILRNNLLKHKIKLENNNNGYNSRGTKKIIYIINSKIEEMFGFQKIW